MIVGPSDKFLTQPGVILIIGRIKFSRPENFYLQGNFIFLAKNEMTSGWVKNLSDGPKIVHGPVNYINLEFETCGAGIWEKKLNLGPSNIYIFHKNMVLGPKKSVKPG